MLKVELTQDVESEATVIHSAQLRPFTFCRLVFAHDDLGDYSGVGFSKVCRPDEWDAERGRELARQKAVAHIVKQILDKTPRFEG